MEPHTQVLRAWIWNLHPLNYECSFNFTWQHYGNRFKHNPVSSFARVASFYFSLKRANEADSSGVSGSALARGSAHAAGAEQSAGGPG